jgi:DNA-binding GntR family transcriptional regulator
MAKSLREKIYQTIRDKITYGELLPGERLIEVSLVKDFKTSRSPIREAIGQLEAEGLITREKNRGISVSKLSIKQVEEIYSIRELLESYATRLMAEMATKKQAEYLGSLHRKLIKAAKKFDLQEWLDNNALFHDFITERCGNQNLIPIIEILQRRIYRYRYMIARIPSSFDTYISHHEKIVAACERNDGQMAEKFMRLHIKTTKDRLIDYLKRFPGF